MVTLLHFFVSAEGVKNFNARRKNFLMKQYFLRKRLCCLFVPDNEPIDFRAFPEN